MIPEIPRKYRWIAEIPQAVNFWFLFPVVRTDFERNCLVQVMADTPLVLIHRSNLSYDFVNVFLRVFLRDFIQTHFWSDFQESLIQPASFFVVGFSRVFLAFLQTCMWFLEKSVRKTSKTTNLLSKFVCFCRKMWI